MKQQTAMSETPEQFSFEQYRLTMALSHFSNCLASEKVAYRKKQFEWMVAGGHNDAPVEPEDRDASIHLNNLFSLFSEIFPDISIRIEDFNYTEKTSVKGLTLANQKQNYRQQINHNTVFDFDISKIKDVDVTGTYTFNIICSKHGNDYLPLELSDGEKQILSMLADRYFFIGKKCLFVVDEPELNLDPVLAMKYWSVVERELKQSVFIYATHSLDFALRDSVERIWSLGGAHVKPLPIEDLGRLPSDEQRRFLSGIRGIVTKDRGLIVEGNDTSFDSTFYPWILGSSANQTQISAYGSCNDVEAATRKMTIWQSLVPSTKIIGVVDRDYKTDEEIQKLNTGNCLTLDSHDAEAYICFPQLLVALAKKIGRSGFPSEQALIDEAEKYLTETEVSICHHRMARRCYSKIQISLKSEQLSNLRDIDELKKISSKLALKYSESDKIGPTPEHVKSVINDEYKNIIKAKGDIKKILQLVNGKALLDRYARHFGLIDGMAIMTYVAEHLTPSEFPHLCTLLENIESKYLV